MWMWLHTSALAAIDTMVTPSYAAFLWGRELEFTGSKLLVFTSNYWRPLIFLQLTTCDHKFWSSRESFGTVFVLVYMVNTSSRPQRNAALKDRQIKTNNTRLQTHNLQQIATIISPCKPVIYLPILRKKLEKHLNTCHKNGNSRNI